MPHVVCLRPLHPEALARLRAEPGVKVTVLSEVTPATLAEPMQDAEAIIVRATRIDDAFLSKAPALRIVARHGVGYDAVDVPALTARGIPLTVTPEANAVSVAEHAMMLMLSIARQAQGYTANLRRGDWGSKDDLPCFDLAGKTVLVVGFGRIGARVAKRCAAFEMRVLVRDPNVPRNTIRGLGYEPVKELGEGLEQADIVTLHLPSNETTRGLVDAQFLARMKPGAVLINTARGTLVQEEALLAALRSRHLAAAGLDVFHQEPVDPANPLLQLPNVVITPHVAAATDMGLRRMGMSCVDSILACFRGELDPDVVINPEVLARSNRA
jgi:D-3-phosphoglycerate dehydrogenase